MKLLLTTAMIHTLLDAGILCFLSESQYAGAWHEGCSEGQSYQQGASAYALAAWS